MKNIILLAFLFCPLILFGQIRVSDIQDIGALGFIHARMLEFEEKEYVVLFDHLNTSVYAMKDNQFNLTSVWSKGGPDQGRIVISNKKNSNQVMTHNEVYIIEGFRNYIKLTHFLSGQEYKRIKFISEDMILGGDNVEIFDNRYLYLTVYAQNQYIKLLIDLETEEVSIPDFDFNKTVYRMGHVLFTVDDKQLKAYDLISGKDSTVFTANTEIGKLFYNTGRLAFSFDGDQLAHVGKNLDVRYLNCSFNEDINMVLIKDSLVIISYSTQNAESTKIFKGQSCDSLLFDLPVLYTPHLFYNLPDKYLILSSPDPILDYVYKILDTEDYKLHELSMSGFFGWDIHHSESTDQHIVYFSALSYFQNLYGSFFIDFKQKTSAILELPGKSNNENLVFGKFRNNQMSVVQVANSTELKWWSVASGESIGNLVSTLPLNTGNRGIVNTVIPVLHDENIFYDYKNQLYLTKGNSTESLYKAKSISHPQVYQNQLYALAHVFPYGFGYLEMDISTLEIKYKFINPDFNVETNNITTPFAILNIPGNGFDGRFIFDLKSKEYKGILLDGSYRKPSKFMISGEMVFLHFTYNGKHNYCLYNTRTDELIKLPIVKNISNLFTDDANNFYFQDPDGSKKIKKLKADGSILDIFDVPSSTVPFIFRLHPVEGPLKILTLTNGSEMVVMLDKNDTFSIQFFTNTKSILLEPAHLYSNGETLLVQTIDTNKQYKHWMWNFGDEPTLISEGGDEKLFFAIPEENIFILFIEQKDSPNKIKVIHYDIPSGNVVQQYEFNMIRNEFGDNVTKLRDHIYIMSFSDGLTGKEPWIYNSKSGSFILLKDIFEGGWPSTPGQFLVLKDNCFFTAIDNDLSRQWFRFNIFTLSNVEKVLGETFGNIYPNPGSNTIQSTQNWYEVQIIDVLGKTLDFRREWKINDYWEISGLMAGTYFIMGKAGNGKTTYQKFIKI